MELEVQMLKEELNRAVLIQPLNSRYILKLSIELDRLILEYYK